jgi:hypothetical protein
MGKEGHEGNEKKRQLSLEDIGVSYGLSALTRSSETFTPQMLANYIDQNELGSEAKRLEERAKNIEKPEEKQRYIVEHLAKFVSGGHAFDERGKRLMKVSDLESQAEYSGVIRTARAASEVMAEDPEAAKLMPEVAEAVIDTRRTVMAHKLANVGYAEGTIKYHEHYQLKHGAEQRYQVNAEQYREALHHYLGRKEKRRMAAAIFLGIVGLALVLMVGPPKVVGGVIGVADPVNAFFILGAFFVVVAILLARRRAKVCSRKFNILLLTS